MKTIKIKQENHGEIEVDPSQPDVIRIWDLSPDIDQHCNVVEVERENVEDLILALRSATEGGRNG